MSTHLKLAEVAAELRVTRRHVLALIHAGELPAIIVSLKAKTKGTGRPEYRVPRDGLDAFKERRAAA